VRGVAARPNSGHALTLWARVRGLAATLSAIGLTLVLLCLPISAAAASPSPAGASIAAAAILALAIPVTVGWGCSRGDARLEGVSTRPIRAFDLVLALAAVGIAFLAAAAAHSAGLAPAGLVGARALLVYLGLMLLFQPFTGWRLAFLAPTVYLVAVVVMGRGSDISHPARWAWIASHTADGWSWALTLGVLAIGLAAYGLVPARVDLTRGDD
jgi:hypothetical protein